MFSPADAFVGSRFVFRLMQFLGETFVKNFVNERRFYRNGNAGHRDKKPQREHDNEHLKIKLGGTQNF